MPEIIIVDTTLRDGEQAPGFAFAPALKIRLASMMDEAGVDQIEAGVPAMGENRKSHHPLYPQRGMHQTPAFLHGTVCEKATCATLSAALPTSSICAARFQTARSRTNSKPHAPKCWPRWQSARHNRQPGCRSYRGFEDASHASPDQLKEAARAARQCGVVRVRLSDTVGCYTPDKVWRAVRMLREAGVDVEIHAHSG